MEKLDIVISINVHEKPSYLYSQINNINEHVMVSKKIILNCNNYMFDELKGVELKDVEINQDFFDKKHYHGSIVKGIISNMKMALNISFFEYFLVMSSREFFYNKLTDISVIKTHNDINNRPIEKRTDYSVKVEWLIEHFRTYTKLFQFVEENKMYFSYSAHEGVCFSYETCKYIVDFLEKNPDIESNLYSVELPAEELACQTLAVNSETGTYYYIGNGCCGEGFNPNKFTLKGIR